MKVDAVKIQGDDNILRYAIKNNADVLNDLEIVDLINLDLVATITLSDVNFYELCRLSHFYRDKLRIVKEAPIGRINDSTFAEIFPGELEDTSNGKKIKAWELVRDVCDGFMNIALQMESDEDIIPSWAAVMFVPMLYRSFTVSVPIPYYEFATCIHGTKVQDVFKDEKYQDNIDRVLFGDEGTEALINIVLKFDRLINREIDSERSAQLVKLIKFQSLGKNTTNRLYHFTPIAFSKYNQFSGFNQRVSFFNGNPEKISREMAAMSTLPSPLKVEFAVQLPLQQLQALERTFSKEDIGVDFLSRSVDIIGNDIRFEDYIIPKYSQDAEYPEDDTVEREASISAYRERIKSCSDMIGALAHLTYLRGGPTPTVNARVEQQSFSPSGLVTVPPAIISTVAVLALDLSKRSKYTSINDILNKSMLHEMVNVMLEINKSLTTQSANAVPSKSDTK